MLYAVSLVFSTLCGAYNIVSNGLVPAYLRYLIYYWRRNAVIVSFFWFDFVRDGIFFRDSWVSVLQTGLIALAASVSLPAVDVMSFGSPLCPKTMR